MNARPGHRSSLPAIFWFGLFVLCCFALFTVMMDRGTFFRTDVAIAGLLPERHGQRIEAISSLLAAAWSPELSLGYGLAASLLLFRMGLGAWSLAPFGFLLALPAEVITKLYVLDPVALENVKSWAPPAISEFQLGPHSVIHGSGIRTGFLGVLGAALLWRNGSLLRRAGSLVLLAAMPAAAGARVLGHDHAFSSEVSGLLLGISLGAMAAGLLKGPMERAASRGRVVDPDPPPAV